VACVCGADFSPHLDGVRLANWQPFFAEKGGTLKFPERVSGNRAYLAVGGGFDIEEWLGSASTNLTAGVGGFEGRKLIAKDRLGTRRKMSIHRKRVGGLISQALRPHYRPFPTVRVVKGTEYECLTGQSRRSLTHHDFTISKDSNRMGFRLVGPPLTFNKHKELLSSAVDFGTIQALPDGQLIVLMADAQTAGGYPRIAHVISRDLPLIAQLGANDKVAFHLVELAEAEELAAEFERELNLLRVGCRFQAKSWD
jgi:antagonist of KipI